MASHHLIQEPEESTISNLDSPDSSPKKAARNQINSNTSIFISLLVHALALIIIGLSALFVPHRPSVVPIFEIVSLEKPKLRPLRPKVQRPPDPPPPEPEAVKPPDAPKLTPQPTKAVSPEKKPDPKVVKENEDEKKPVKEYIPEEQVLLPQVAMSAPQDPRLSLWAARVKKKVDQLWNAPSGLDVTGVTKVMVTFRITRNGSVQAPRITQTSGNASLDEIALMTIKRLENVPPIPENFPNDELEVGFEFLYQGH